MDVTIDTIDYSIYDVTPLITHGTVVPPDSEFT